MGYYYRLPVIEEPSTFSRSIIICCMLMHYINTDLHAAALILKPN